MKSKLLSQLKQRLGLLANEKLRSFERVFQPCSANLEKILCLTIDKKAKERQCQECKVRSRGNNLKIQTTSYDQTLLALVITIRILTLAEKWRDQQFSLVKSKIPRGYQKLTLKFLSLTQVYSKIIKVRSLVQTWSVYLQHLLQTYRLKQSDSEILKRPEMLAMILLCSLRFDKNRKRV